MTSPKSPGILSDEDCIFTMENYIKDKESTYNKIFYFLYHYFKNNNRVTNRDIRFKLGITYHNMNQRLECFVIFKFLSQIMMCKTKGYYAQQNRDWWEHIYKKHYGQHHGQ